MDSPDRRYLVEERGLSASSTVPHYLDVAAVFFGHLLIREPADLGGLAGSQVTDFVLAESRRRSAGYTKSIATRLRCLLRYLHVEGLIPNALVTAVPSVASWQLTVLPQAISAADVIRLLKSCDRRRVIGRRDFAILNVLVRLGLRAGEVAALRLDDIDWRLGGVTVQARATARISCRSRTTWETRSSGGCSGVDHRAPVRRSSPVSWRRTARCPPGVSRESCVRPVGGQVFRRWVPIGFDTRSRPRPYGPGEAWPRSGSSCVKTAQPSRPFTPRSTGLRCPRWFSPGPVVRHERPSSVLG